MAKEVVVVFPHLPWDFPCDFIKQTTLELAKKTTVIVYNSLDFLSLKNLIFDKSRRKEWASLFKEKGLIYFPSLAIIPLQRFSWIRSLNISINRLFFRLFYLLKFGFKKPIFWFFCYPSEELKGYFGWEKILVYDRVDQISSLDIRDNQKIERRDKEFLKIADIVFTNSPYALKYIKNYNESSFLVPCGCDLSLFSIRKSKIISAMRKISRPILGFVGGIDHRLNFQILYSLIKKRKDWSFVFIGDAFINDSSQFKITCLSYWLERIKGLNNVHFLGRKPKDKIPNFIAGLDVCLIPYDISQEFVKGCNPMKLYEYLVMGKAVVSTPIEAIRKYSPIIKIANNAVGFEREIEKFLKESHNKRKEEKRKKIALRNSWEKKIEKMWEKVSI